MQGRLSTVNEAILCLSCARGVGVEEEAALRAVGKDNHAKADSVWSGEEGGEVGHEGQGIVPVEVIVVVDTARTVHDEHDVQQAT